MVTTEITLIFMPSNMELKNSSINTHVLGVEFLTTNHEVSCSILDLEVFSEAKIPITIMICIKYNAVVEFL